MERVWKSTLSGGHFLHGSGSHAGLGAVLDPFTKRPVYETSGTLTNVNKIIIDWYRNITNIWVKLKESE